LIKEIGVTGTLNSWGRLYETVIQVAQKCAAEFVFKPMRQHSRIRRVVPLQPTGPAEFVINNIAKDLEAGVVVLGTVARTGMSGLFIGNTAEAVLEGSSTDVLVVKQAGFESA